MVENHNEEYETENEAMNLNYSELTEHIQQLLTRVREKSTGQTIKKELEALEDYYERQTQIRSMHIQTLTCEVEELKKKNTALVERVVNVRHKCLVRKFQSRFWMFMTSLTMLEVFSPGIMRFVVVDNVYPGLVELVNGKSLFAQTYRTFLLLFMNYQTLVALNAGKYLTKLKELFC